MQLGQYLEDSYSIKINVSNGRDITTDATDIKKLLFCNKKKPLATLIKEKKEQSQIHINKQSGKYQIREKKR